MNDAYKEAIREAYALAPSNVMTLETLEIYNPLIGGRIFLVQDRRNWELTLETGETVIFKGAPVRMALPKINDNGVQELSISIDNVDKQIGQFVKVAKSVAASTQVKYRPYLSTDTSAPQLDPPMRLFMLDLVVTVFEVRGRAAFINYLNKKFPDVSEYYNRRRFPSLGN